MDWSEVAEYLKRRVGEFDAQEQGGAQVRLNAGQRASLRTFAHQLPRNGMVLADEVGMGKTRIATQLIEAVVRCGGRVAVLIPSGLGFQWHRELSDAGIDSENVLRGILGYMASWGDSNSEALNERQVVVLSHAFASGRIKSDADVRRWLLLPALVATLRRRAGWDSGCSLLADVRKRGESKRKGAGESALYAASTMADKLELSVPSFAQALLEFARTTQWARLMRASGYTGESECRRMLTKAVGLGFGRFDLVIVDEAHKSRGEDSRLSKLLDEMLHIDDRSRVVAMSATPVELDASQWVQTLGRIRIPAARLPAIKSAVLEYSDALKRVRRSWRTSEDARVVYALAAGAFQRELGDFVVRRDKREDADVQSYEAHGGRNYRNTDGEIAVETESLSTPWKQAICAAEALSVIRRKGDASDKRLRLTLASGHGTSRFLDEDEAEEAKIQKALEDERKGGSKTAEEVEGTTASHGGQRAAWWRGSLEASLRAVDDPEYGHPGLLAAVAAIEKRTSKREKVLVFGRYTRPMHALEQFLNARELLRRLADGRYWPQSHLRDDQWAAVRAAHRRWTIEHKAAHPVDLAKIDMELAEQFRSERNLRERFRNSLVQRLGEAVAARPFYRRLWIGLRGAAARAFSSDMDTHPVALLARALLELSANSAADMEPQALGQEFAALVDAVMDNDGQATDDDEDTDIDPTQGWTDLERRLRTEYGSRTGEFARFMHGGTATESRRVIQQAFNRTAAAPMVLIAQSLVGREGLNLHQACRTVVLLHPEWNPAVVEQQIGRVDRVGSRWAQDLVLAVSEGRRSEELPRIEVLPVVFRGTYDDHNWRVLRERWDDLRAQLHGEVIPPRLVGTDCTDDERSILEELESVAPTFSPTAAWREN